MFVVMENKNDVIVVADSEVEYHKSLGFKASGTRKTIRGAEKLAEKCCD